jgi:exonuclease VII small subunit
MTDFSIPREPDPETKEDAYKLAMLAAQLDRLQNGGLDLNSAYKAWQ